MRRCLLPIVMLSACGRIGFDAQLVQDANDESPVDAAPMVASGPFETPTLIDELVDGILDDDDPTLPSDMLELYFKRDTGPGATRSDIFFARRANLTDAWTTPVRVEELSSDGKDDSPEVSFDGLTIRFASDRDGVVDIYRSTRPNRDVAWSTPQRVAELSSGGDDYAPAADRDDLHISLSRFLAGSAQLLEASRVSAADPWGTPTLIDELNTPMGYEADSSYGESGLRIFYTSDLGSAGREVVSARRSALDQPFVADAAMGSINSSDDDEDPWVSDDLATIFFVRDTGGVKHIYTATRPLGP